MNKAASWSVKGVDFDAREAAEAAAQRSGLSLGEWLNNVIAERAAEQQITPEELDTDARLEAVTARLQRLSQGGETQERRRSSGGTLPFGERRRSDSPMRERPKRLADQVIPMQGLLRPIDQDRAVTNSVANYAPREGDELVGDDSRVWRVKRVIAEKIVVMECATQPMTMYVDVHDLHNYFIGKPRTAAR